MRSSRLEKLNQVEILRVALVFVFFDCLFDSILFSQTLLHLDDSLGPVLSLRDTTSGGLCDFHKLPRIEAHRNGALGSYQNFRDLRLSATVRAAVGHFIAKARSLEDDREDGKGTKDCSPEWGGRHRGRQRRKGGGSGALMDKLTEVFRCFDGQRQSTVWSCVVPREGINPIAAQIPMFAD
jgi:hypothetical protein